METVLKKDGLGNLGGRDETITIEEKFLKEEMVCEERARDTQICQVREANAQAHHEKRPEARGLFSADQPSVNDTIQDRQREDPRDT
jgi:hypothetical protein